MSLPEAFAMREEEPYVSSHWKLMDFLSRMIGGKGIIPPRAGESCGSGEPLLEPALLTAIAGNKTAREAMERQLSARRRVEMAREAEAIQAKRDAEVTDRGAQRPVTVIRPE